MEYIVKVLELLEKLGKYFSVETDEKDFYAGIIVALLEKVDGADFSNNSLRKDIISFLNEIDVEKRDILVASELGLTTGLPEEEKEKVLVRPFLYDELDDSKLLSVFLLVCRTISWTQKGDLLLLKYSKVIWKTGWHKLAKQCRGKVINWKKRCIVSYPFDKFYNLNEVEETKEDVIRPLLETADAVYVTDKKDGSAIIVTNYNGYLVINTNGEFDNIQITLAKRLFEEKYGEFYHNIPSGYTFVFELIHPENQIVIDYGNTKKLYLLAIRNLKTLKLLSYPQLLAVARKYHLDITESFDFENLDTFLDKALNDAGSGKEGWVFRVINGDKDFMFKLKYAEYFKLARIKNIPTLKKVYSLLVSDKLDDILADVEDELKNNVLADIDEIYDIVESYKSYIFDRSEALLEKYRLNRGELSNESAQLVMKEMGDSPFVSYIMRYLRGYSLDALFDRLPKPMQFGKMLNYLDKLNGITEDRWETVIKH